MNKEKKSRAGMIKRGKKGIYLLPNLVTSASLFCGFYAIIAAIRQDFLSAAVAILFACFFDGVDGKIARLANATTKFGTEYDSLADLVSFGVAPGVLIFLWALQPYGRFGWLASFLYVACCALRLARFNSQPGGMESKYFKGLPTTGAASFIGTLVLVFYRMGEGHLPHGLIILFMAYSISFLMVSNIKFNNLGNLQLFKRKPFSFLVAVVLTLIVVAAEPQIILFILSVIYILSGPLMMIVSFKRGRIKKPLIDQEI